MLTSLAGTFSAALVLIVAVGAAPEVGATGTNLIANPSVERAVNHLPASWTRGETGTAHAVFRYLSSGHTGARSLQVDATTRSRGQAYWASAAVKVTPKTRYTLTDWYESDVATRIVITLTDAAGVARTNVSSEPASPTWRQASVAFTTAAGESSLTVRHGIDRIGQLTTDDYDLRRLAQVGPTGSGSAGGPNMIVDPSLETAAAHGRPAGWQPVQWGSHATTFSYLNSGHRGRHSLEVQTTAWTSGAAEWYYDDVAVKPGASYRYSDWYRADVPTVVDAEVVNGDGTLSYYSLGPAPANPTWSRFTTTFTPPVGTQSIAIYQAIAQVGYLVTDDYSLRAYRPAPFRRPIVSIDFDDGWASQYTNAVPLLRANGLTASFYIITSQSITAPNPICMDVADLRALIADGDEIGNHTATHPDLTTLRPAQVQAEMSDAQAAFQDTLGITPTDFAYPYGVYDPQTIAIGQQVGFASQRGVNAGFNTKDDIDFTQLKVEEVDTNTTPAQVEGWVN